MRITTPQSTDQHLIITWKAISSQLGVCPATARYWRSRDGLPVATLPNGQVATTKSLIDQWILSRMDVKRKRDIREAERRAQAVADQQHAA